MIDVLIALGTFLVIFALGVSVAWVVYIGWAWWRER